MEQLESLLIMRAPLNDDKLKRQDGGDVYGDKNYGQEALRLC